MLDEEKGQTQLPCKQKPLPDRDVISAGATGAIAPISLVQVQLVQLHPSSILRKAHLYLSIVIRAKANHFQDLFPWTL